MSNNKFPGFIEITAERAQAIQYDVQLWYSFDADSEAYKAYSQNIAEIEKEITRGTGKITGITLSRKDVNGT